MLMYY